MAITIRTPEIEDTVLERLSNGEALNAICDENFPVAEATVRKWAINDPDGFGARYARARDIGLDCRADAMIDRAKAATDAGLGRLAPLAHQLGRLPRGLLCRLGGGQRQQSPHAPHGHSPHALHARQHGRAPQPGRQQQRQRQRQWQWQQRQRQRE
jgi:hypothetical protein